MSKLMSLALALSLLFSLVSCAAPATVEVVNTPSTADEPTATAEAPKTEGEPTKAANTPTAEEQPTDAAEATRDTTPYEIDWYVDLPWWSWPGRGWGEDLTSKTIQEKTGVKINFIVPASDSGEQLAGMIASGDLPDVITVNGWWDTEKRALTNQLATEGYIWAYNDLIDQYAPSMWDEVRMDMFNWHSEADGKTYLLQNYSYGEKDLEPGERLLPNGSIIVRKDLWEAIGSPDMSTPEGFLAAAEKVKNEIGEYNGQEIIPLQLYENVGNSTLWLSQFFATPYEDENGNWVYDFEQENYKDALKFLNDAYNRGLIVDANFSDTRDLVNEKLASGRVFAAVVAAQDFFPQIQALYDADNEAVYMPVALHNYKGDEPVLQDIRGFGWLNTAITTNAENPDRIIQLFEYLLSEEGQRDAAHGVEGVTYELDENGKIVPIDTGGDPKDYALGGMMMLDNWALRRKWQVPPTDPRAIATSEDTLKAGLEQYTYDFNAAALKIDPTDPDLADINDKKIKMDELRKRYIAQMIVAPTPEEFERLYQEALTELEALGLAEVKEFNNKYFQAAKEALGIERSYGVRND